MRDWRLFYPQVRQIELESSIEATSYFITSRLTLQRKEMMEMVEGMRKRGFDFARPTLLEAASLVEGYNKAISDIIKALGE